MPSDDSQKLSVKRQNHKWSPEEDTLIIELRGKGMKWEDISKRLPGRSAISCRLHYQNYLERRSEWDEERKNKLARLYERFKLEMWAKVAEDMAVPWRAVEAMHWQLGEADMARRAGVIPFSLIAGNLDGIEGDQTSPPSSGDPKLPQSQCVLESGLAPIQNQPPPRTADMLPGVAELAGGVSLYSTPTAAPYLESSTRTERGLGDSSLARYSIKLARSKRERSPDQFMAIQRQRIV